MCFRDAICNLNIEIVMHGPDAGTTAIRGGRRQKGSGGWREGGQGRESRRGAHGCGRRAEQAKGRKSNGGSKTTEHLSSFSASHSTLLASFCLKLLGSS
eukprot:3307909-Rhodomonas_salina.3